MQSNALHNLNRKIHIHLGLLLLLFIWLFSFSGLILNHGGWKFASFWDEREESKKEFTVPLVMLNDPSPEERILELQKVSGEVQAGKHNSEVLEFRVQSPGIVRDFQVDLRSGAGTEKVLKYNIWGKLRTLHTFNGMTRENSAQSPNWLITNIWRFTMDGIAIGLIIICISSWIMWYKIRREYKWGYIILGGAFAFAGYFIWWT